MERAGHTRVGIAGLGRFGSLHASILAGMPDVEITAVCDPDGAHLASMAARYNVPHTFESFGDFVEFPHIDTMFIVTPEDLHESMVTAAIQRELPLFMEKPLALSSSSGREIVELASSAGVYLQIGFVLRFETRHALLQERVSKGEMGDLVTIRAKRNCSRAWFDSYADRAHSVYETIVHDIDYIIWLVDSPCQSVYAKERNLSGKTFPDATIAMLEFANGIVATLETSWLVPDRAPANVLTDAWFGTIDSELEVVGTRQSARLRLLETGLEFWTDEVSQHPEIGLWPEVRGAVGGALEAEDRYFIERVRTGTPGSVASVDDAVSGLEIAEAIVESVRRESAVQLTE